MEILDKINFVLQNPNMNPELRRLFSGITEDKAARLFEAIEGANIDKLLKRLEMRDEAHKSLNDAEFEAYKRKRMLIMTTEDYRQNPKSLYHKLEFRHANIMHDISVSNLKDREIYFHNTFKRENELFIKLSLIIN